MSCANTINRVVDNVTNPKHALPTGPAQGNAVAAGDCATQEHGPTPPEKPAFSANQIAIPAHDASVNDTTLRHGQSPGLCVQQWQQWYCRHSCHVFKCRQ